MVINGNKWFANKKKYFPNYILYDLVYDGIIFHEFFRIPWPLRLRRGILAILCNITICVVGNSYKWFANKNTFLNIYFMTCFMKG